MVFSGGRTSGASGQTDTGPGNRQRSLVRRGWRSTVCTRRGVSSWLIGANGPGTEVSSPAPDTHRSPGRGVEEVPGTTRVGTPGKSDPSALLRSSSRWLVSLNRGEYHRRTPRHLPDGLPDSGMIVVGPVTDTTLAHPAVDRHQHRPPGNYLVIRGPRSHPKTAAAAGMYPETPGHPPKPAPVDPIPF